MVWYKGKEISIDEIENLPEGGYVLVRKDYKMVGGPIRPKSELVNTIKNTNIPKKEIEIQSFNINFPNKIRH